MHPIPGFTEEDRVLTCNACQRKFRPGHLGVYVRGIDACSNRGEPQFEVCIIDHPADECQTHNLHEHGCPYCKALREAPSVSAEEYKQTIQAAAERLDAKDLHAKLVDIFGGPRFKLWPVETSMGSVLQSLKRDD